MLEIQLLTASVMSSAEYTHQEVILLTMLIVLVVAIIAILIVNIRQNGVLDTLVRLLGSGPW
jgi:hypothetical protein